jgi:hypothetical protein
VSFAGVWSRTPQASEGFARVRWLHALAMKTFILGIIPPADPFECGSPPQGLEVVSG